MPARLVSLGDDDVDAVLDVPPGMLDRPGERRDGHPLLVGEVDHVLRRGAECVGDEGRTVPERDVDVGAGDRMQPSEDTGCVFGGLVERRHAEFGEGALDEGTVLGGDELVEVDGGPLGGDLRGHHDVDAVGLAVGVLVHPGEDVVEFGRVVEPDAAEDAETTGPADRGGDVLGRGEPEDRVLDSEFPAEIGVHPGPF
ncbi:hypothetical protein RHRU231_750051 [Rhodococcus ruber]|uniref:Uncharacterized protein n=1 Tax=Rhodococcus ruber TaxID=1830 RepID=A0A098BPR1_9NOCA|nr:hypothetical protein RHRU231_750051 [Rhodococcus ruber]